MDPISAMMMSTSALNAGSMMAGADMFSSILGGLMGSNSAKSQQRWTNHWNRVQYEWQRELATSGIQMRARDYEAAGLNPILAASGGFGAGGTGGGFSPGQVQGPAEGSSKMIQAAASALALRRQSADIENVRSSTEKNKADTKLSNEAAKTQVTQQGLSSAQAAKAAAEKKVIDSTQPGRDVEAQIDKSAYGKALRYLGRLNPFGSSAKAISDIFK